jgi:hypothetical protein
LSIRFPPKAEFTDVQARPGDYINPRPWICDPVIIIQRNNQEVARLVPKDLFDRLLVAQANRRNMTLVIRDTELSEYAVSRFWM